MASQLNVYRSPNLLPSPLNDPLGSETSKVLHPINAYGKRRLSAGGQTLIKKAEMDELGPEIHVIRCMLNLIFFFLPL